MAPRTCSKCGEDDMTDVIDEPYICGHCIHIEEVVEVLDEIAKDEAGQKKCYFCGTTEGVRIRLKNDDWGCVECLKNYYIMNEHEKGSETEGAQELVLDIESVNRLMLYCDQTWQHRGRQSWERIKSILESRKPEAVIQKESDSPKLTMQKAIQIGIEADKKVKSEWEKEDKKIKTMYNKPEQKDTATECKCYLGGGIQQVLEEDCPMHGKKAEQSKQNETDPCATCKHWIQDGDQRWHCNSKADKCGYEPDRTMETSEEREAKWHKDFPGDYFCAECLTKNDIHYRNISRMGYVTCKICRKHTDVYYIPHIIASLIGKKKLISHLFVDSHPFRDINCEKCGQPIRKWVFHVCEKKGEAGK